MKEIRFFYVPDAYHQHELPVEEAMHAVKVLRLKSGDEIHLTDGCGAFYQAEVTIATPKALSLRHQERASTDKRMERANTCCNGTYQDDRPRGMVRRESNRNRNR